jgi:hypothetical protein
LRGVGRINFEECPASFCRFAGQHIKKVRPGRVTDAFGKTVIVQHSVDREVFYRNKTKLVDNLSAVLMGKVGPAPPNALMHPGDYLTFGFALGCAFFSFGQFTLGFCQRFFFFSKEPGISNLLTIREGSKGFKPNVNTNLTRIFREYVRFNPFATEANIPFASTTFGERDSFDLTFDRTVEFNFDVTNLANNQGRVFQFAAGGGLGKGYRVVTAKTLKAGITRFLSRFNPPKESFQGKFEPDRYILQDLGMNLTERRSFNFKKRQLSLLVIQADAFAGFFINAFALAKPVIVQPATIFKLLFEQGFLAFGRPYSEFERLSHTNILSEFTQKIARLV